MDGQAINNASPDASPATPGEGWRAVDARGLACPIPALRLARAVRERGAGRYELLADDPAALHDIPALAAERGWALVEAGSGRFRVVVAG
jgi:tRNA 2-thiouridine synthesizing protein A